MRGPCQAIGRAELSAVEEVILREERPVRLRVDNAWVVAGMQILLAGHPPDPLWEHIDIWVRVWDTLQTRASTVRVQKVKGHLDDALIAAGKGTEDERRGNDSADDKAKAGVREDEQIWEAKGACASLRNLAIKTHRMMVEIGLARAAVLKERQAQATAPTAGGSPSDDALPTEEDIQAAPGFAEGDLEDAKSYFLGLPKGAAWQDYTAQWPLSADMRQAVVA